MIVINFLSKQIGKLKVWYLLFLAVVFVIPLIFILSTRAGKNLIDSLQSGNNDVVKQCIIAFFLAQLLIESIWRIRDLIKIEFSTRIKMVTFNSIIKRLLLKDSDFFKKNSVSSIVAVSRYISESTEKILIIHFKIVRYVMYSISASYAIICLDWTAGQIIVAWLFIWLIGTYGTFLYISKYVVNVSNLKNQFLSQLSDSFSNIENIFLYKTQDHEEEKLYLKTNNIMQYERSTEKILLLLWIFQGIGFSCVMVAILWTIMHKSKNIALESGKFVMVIRLLIEFANQMWSFSDDMSDLIEGYAKIKSGFIIINSAQDENELEKVYVQEDPIAPGITFKNVRFSQGSKKFFFNCNISKRQNVALIGASGSGKTTFVRLLTGILQPNSGKITNYSNNFAYVSQNARLFNASVKYNLTYGLNREVTEEELDQVIEKCNLEFIKNLKNGYDSIISNNTLSGGQAQRIIIARSVLRKSEILVFDEPTSALDNKNEKDIVNLILGLPGTKVVISHKISTLKKADKIILFKDCKIVGEGTYEDLKSKPENLVILSQ